MWFLNEEYKISLDCNCEIYRTAAKLHKQQLSPFTMVGFDLQIKENNIHIVRNKFTNLAQRSLFTLKPFVNVDTAIQLNLFRKKTNTE